MSDQSYTEIIDETDPDENHPVVDWDAYDRNPLPDEARIVEAQASQAAAEGDPVPAAEAMLQESPPAPASAPAPGMAVLSHEESLDFRTRWNEIQARFVDEPHAAVEQADALVCDVVEQISRMFAAEHNTLASRWNQGNETSTEDLRLTLQAYRAFFNRLVA